MKRTKTIYVEDVINYVKEVKKLKQNFDKKKEKLKDRFQVVHIGEVFDPESIIDKNLEYSELFVKMVEDRSFKELVSMVKKT